MPVIRNTVQKMVLSCSLPFALLSLIPVLASPLQAPSLPSSTLSYSLPTFNSNTTSSSTPNASSTEDAALDIRCSGEHFGYNPNIIDCESAKEHVTPDSVQYTWGNRHTGLEAIVFPLPYRIMGGQ